MKQNFMSRKFYLILRKNKVAILTSVVTSLVCFLVLLVLAGSLIISRGGSWETIKTWLRNNQTVTGERLGLFSSLTEESRVVTIVAKANPAVVSIVITKDVPIIEQYYQEFSPFGDNFFDDFFGGGFNFRVPRQRQRGTEKREVGGGSGFFVSADGLVVTNKHVVDDDQAEYTVLTNDGQKYAAKILAKDSALDVAVLKVKGENFSYLAFGDSDLLKLGQTVIAIGNALAEFRNSVSVGVVSGLSRSIVAGGPSGGSEYLEGVIQTDAAINPGNSGGPLLNLEGEVVGVNVAVERGAENIGFALPGSVVKSIADSVKQYGEIIRPYLGVRYVQVTDSLKEKNNLPVNYGALIQRGETAEDLAVIPGSPADKAGLAEGDIILEMDGIKIEPGRSLASLIRQKQVGQMAQLKVLRQSVEKKITVILAKAPAGI